MASVNFEGVNYLHGYGYGSRTLGPYTGQGLGPGPGGMQMNNHNETPNFDTHNSTFTHSSDQIIMNETFGGGPQSSHHQASNVNGEGPISPGPGPIDQNFYSPQQQTESLQSSSRSNKPFGLNHLNVSIAMGNHTNNNNNVNGPVALGAYKKSDTPPSLPFNTNFLDNQNSSNAFTDSDSNENVTTPVNGSNNNNLASTPPNPNGTGNYFKSYSNEATSNTTSNNGNSANTNNNGNSPDSGQALYKTELCRSFAETGSCRYANKCRFAHGQQELRPLLRHKKYKTEKCKNYVKDGVCPYGSRCRFLHEQDDEDTEHKFIISDSFPSQPHNANNSGNSNVSNLDEIVSPGTESSSSEHNESFEEVIPIDESIRDLPLNINHSHSHSFNTNGSDAQRQRSRSHLPLFSRNSIINDTQTSLSPSQVNQPYQSVLLPQSENIHPNEYERNGNGSILIPGNFLHNLDRYDKAFNLENQRHSQPSFSYHEQSINRNKPNNNEVENHTWAPPVLPLSQKRSISTPTSPFLFSVSSVTSANNSQASSTHSFTSSINTSLSSYNYSWNESKSNFQSSVDSTHSHMLPTNDDPFFIEKTLHATFDRTKSHLEANHNISEPEDVDTLSVGGLLENLVLDTINEKENQSRQLFDKSSPMDSLSFMKGIYSNTHNTSGTSSVPPGFEPKVNQEHNVINETLRFSNEDANNYNIFENQNIYGRNRVNSVSNSSASTLNNNVESNENSLFSSPLTGSSSPFSPSPRLGPSFSTVTVPQNIYHKNINMTQGGAGINDNSSMTGSSHNSPVVHRSSRITNIPFSPPQLPMANSIKSQFAQPSAYPPEEISSGNSNGISSNINSPQTSQSDSPSYNPLLSHNSPILLSLGSFRNSIKSSQSGPLPLSSGGSSNSNESNHQVSDLRL